ncbi:uncharacterized protein TNCV_1285711 [Trichonephila clavipes]|uniref:Uncharacterized protein n=1 Tax=Trichonephila clavipes TaxID=2585209 RepID=A0A8X6SM02_TRICX|nr:uncharacterized protein TNCV_1285711 [Trichonephila clavipes]
MVGSQVDEELLVLLESSTLPPALVFSSSKTLVRGCGCRLPSRTNGPKTKDQGPKWYWARTRDKASHGPIPIPLGYRGHNSFAGGLVLYNKKIIKPRFRFQWLVTLTAAPLGMSSNPGEGMDVCKCIVSLRHEITLNSCQAVSPLVRLVEGEERRASDHPQGVLPLNWGTAEPN